MRDLIAKQRVLQRVAYGYDPGEMRGEERVEFIRWNVLALTDELHEMLHEVDSWKPWQTERSNAGTFKDIVEFREGVVDSLHFLANLGISSGMDDRTLAEMFERKQAKNLARQLDGYAGVGKDHDAKEGA